ncbi:MAG: LA_1612 family putative O-antigen biosynthesis protein [Pseudomonadota bacterium]
MSPYLKKLAAFCSYFWHAKKTWSWPKKSDILIFDACGEALLREYLSDWSIEVLPVRGERINVPLMLASLFVSGRRSEAYFDLYVRKVAPKLIITFIDNTPAFYRLTVRHPGVKTMFIQNGWRSRYGDVFELLTEPAPSQKNALAVDYMMCFGSAIGAHFQRYIAGEVMAIGALRNNRQPQLASKAAGTIAFISQWSRHGVQLAGKTYSQDAFMGTADRCILAFLSKYAAEHKKKLYIIPRTHVGSVDRRDETSYYSALLGKACSFLEYDTPGSSYQAIDVAEVVVGVDSTLVYETIARGNKAAVFAIRSALMGVEGFEYGWPAPLAAEGAFWTNSPSPERFRAVLDYLFSTSEAQWRAELKRVSFEQLMVFDPDNTILKTTLTQVLRS